MIVAERRAFHIPGRVSVASSWVRGILLALPFLWGGCVPLSEKELRHPRDHLCTLDIESLGRVWVDETREGALAKGLVVGHAVGDEVLTRELCVPPPHVGQYKLVSLAWRPAARANEAVLLLQVSLGEVGSYRIFAELFCSVIHLRKGHQPVEVLSQASGSTELTRDSRRVGEGYRLTWNEQEQVVEIRDEEEDRTLWRGP